MIDLKPNECEIYYDPEFGFVMRRIKDGRERDCLMEAQDTTEAQLEAMEEGYEVKGIYN